MQHDHVMIKLNFDLLTPRVVCVRGVCWQNVCYHVASFRDSIFKFDMQHLQVLKKLNFDLLTPSPGIGVGGQNIRYHVAAFVIPFNLICKMTLF